MKYSFKVCVDGFFPPAAFPGQEIGVGVSLPAMMGQLNCIPSNLLFLIDLIDTLT